jgi:co-chaperonin GroES (HSP10)
MITPRNSLVIVKLIDAGEKKLGKFFVPNNKERYSEAFIIAVGPGNVSAAGGRSETFDLKAGQRVFMQHKQMGRDQYTGQMKLEIAGIEYREGDEVFHIFEQTNILTILAEDEPLPEALVEAAEALTN